jgi:hypothetical protein
MKYGVVETGPTIAFPRSEKDQVLRAWFVKFIKPKHPAFQQLPDSLALIAWNAMVRSREERTKLDVLLTPAGRLVAENGRLEYEID